MFLPTTMGIMGSKLLIFHLFDIFPVTVLLLLDLGGRGAEERESLQTQNNSLNRTEMSFSAIQRLASHDMLSHLFIDLIAH